MTTAATSVPAMTEPYLLEDATPAPRVIASLSTAPLHVAAHMLIASTSATSLELNDNGPQEVRSQVCSLIQHVSVFDQV